jgi:hypothetical protein
MMSGQVAISSRGLKRAISRHPDQFNSCSRYYLSMRTQPLETFDLRAVQVKIALPQRPIDVALEVTRDTEFHGGI